MKNLNNISTRIKSGFESGNVSPQVEKGWKQSVRFVATGCADEHSKRVHLMDEHAADEHLHGYSPVPPSGGLLPNYPCERLSNPKTERKHAGTLCLPVPLTCADGLNLNKLFEGCATSNFEPQTSNSHAATKGQKNYRKEVCHEKICG